MNRCSDLMILFDYNFQTFFSNCFFSQTKTKLFWQREWGRFKLNPFSLWVHLIQAYEVSLLHNWISLVSFLVEYFLSPIIFMIGMLSAHQHQGLSEWSKCVEHTHLLITRNNFFKSTYICLQIKCWVILYEFHPVYIHIRKKAKNKKIFNIKSPFHA